MSASATISRRFSLAEVACSAAAALVRSVHALITAPSLLFLATLTVMLFRPPDLQFYSLDRFAFLLLIFVVMLGVFLQRRSLRLTSRLTWPMLALLTLALSGALTQPFDPQTWSLLAAKFVVPYTLFHLSVFVFDTPESLRRFETFSLLVLAYLSFTAIAFLIGATGLIFPRYILDESLGIHIDRARGPFLQAVANGVTLNILGLIALDAFRRGRLRGVWAIVLLASLPVAILATMTRTVWVSFAGSAVVLGLRTSNRSVRRACLCLVVVGVIGTMGALLSAEMRTSLHDRAEERGPIEIRMAVYKAGWLMFLERPISGWGINQMPPELAKRMSDYHLQTFWVHNTYLEVLVEHGIFGFAIYLSIIVGLFRLGRKPSLSYSAAGNFLDKEFRAMWPLILAVYLVNATFVVMNYQFVNGLLFTMAGMLSAQNRRESDTQADVLAS